MKTLVVLIALAGIASAAPASPQAKGFKIIASRSPSFIKRQKKSPQQQESFIPQSPESVSQFETLPDDFSADVNGPTASARSHFGFKGPIVVKKKSGYHYYRNSEEERAAADPHENCGKQMRVKLCNSHVNRRSNDMIAATNDNRNPKDDVELSMQVAEEALQSLQKNMQKMEENGQWKHGQSELDTTMHQNIEAVRQALQNVQGRIGKKETTNLQATTLKDTKLDHVSQGKSQEERLAQWKGTKQKNVEVASNIEDRFKSADNLLLSSAIDTTKMMRSNGQEHKNNRVPTISSLTISKHAADETDKLSKLDQHKTLEKRTSEKNDMDVTAAASEHIKTTAEHIPSTPKGKSNDLAVASQGIKPNAKAEWNKDARSTDTHLSLSSTNHVHEHENIKSKTETSFRNSENKFQGSHTLHNIQKVNTAEHATSNKFWEHKSEHLKQGKSTWEETQSENTFMKTAEQTNLAKTTAEIKIPSLAEHIDKKTAEEESELSKKLSLDLEKAASEIDIHTDVLKNAKPELQTKSSEFELNVKGHGMHMGGHDMHKGGQGMFVGGQGMHMAGKEMHGMHMQGHGMHMQGHGMHMQGHGTHMEGHGMHMQGQGIHMQGQGMHMQGQGIRMKEHDMHIGFQAGMKHGKFGKSSDVDIAMQESDQMDTLETAEKSAKENMLQWKHHDNARTSYGGYALGGLNLGGASGVHLAGAGGPAVGVFPHAKVGGCAIPLLLSCSPSVVQGSLAKSHSSYAAPAYKESDDLNSKKKRDAVKTSKDLTSSKMKMPTKKNTEILETML